MKKITTFLVLLTAFSLLLSSCAFYLTESGISSDEASGKLSESEKEDISETDASEEASRLDTPAMSDKLPNSSENVSDTEKKNISVVVLGDSIARGYGLNDVETQRFSSILKKKLESADYNASVTNYGTDGQTGKELLEWLTETPPSELDDCDCVIISIGGNNILGSLSSMTSKLDDFKNIDPAVFKDYFLYLFAKDEAIKQKYAYSCDTINEVFKKANAVFMSEDFNALIEKAGNDLGQELPQIIAEIKKHNPDADIYVQTVYNPYHNVKISLAGVEEALDMSHYGDIAVAELNTPIKSLAKENGYTAVPIYESFKNSKNTLINAGFDISNTRFSVDPHPNALGHQLIAEIYFSAIKNKNLTEEQNG